MPSSRATSAGAVLLAEVEGQLRIGLAYEPDKDALVIPKGQVETGESLEEAAAREVREETGLDDFQLVTYLGSFERDSTEDTGEVVHKTIHLFLAFAKTAAPLSAGGNWLVAKAAIEAIPFREDRDFLAEKLRPMIRQ